MILEEAIKTAILYETKACEVYRDALKHIQEPKGRRIFQSLAEDEQRHRDYLIEKLQEWKSSGQLTVSKLKSAVPSPESISAESEKLEETLTIDDRGDQKQLLSKALKMEIESSDFYRRLVEEMPRDAKPLFSVFLEIEDRHIAAVQAQLDYISGTGYWFDFKEFDME